MGLCRLVDPSVVLLAGPAGVGRSTALGEYRAAALRQGRAVLDVPLVPSDEAGPWRFLARLAVELRGRHEWERPSGLNRGASPAIGDPEDLVAALARGLRGLGETVVLVDDLQWIDESSAAVLPRLLRGLTGSAVRCVATVRTPVLAEDRAAQLDRLRREGLVAVRPLRPLSRAEVTDILRRDLAAQPSAGLRDEVFRASRGVAAGVQAVLHGLRSAGAIQVADRRADLVGVGEPLAVPADHTLLAPIREAPEPVWSVAAALAVVSVVGPGAARIVAEVLDLPPSAVMETLGTLVRLRVLREVRPGGWRFRDPVTEAALRAAVAPYRSRQLSRHAVDALWRGEAEPGDPTLVGELLVAAGRSAQPERSARELIGAAHGLPLTDRRAQRWFAVAAELSDGFTQRREALLGHARAAARVGDHDAALRGAQAVLSAAGDDAVDARQLSLVALRGLGDDPALEAAAAGEPGAGPAAVAVQATALVLLDRWGEAARRLGGSPAPPPGPVASAHHDLAALIATVVGPHGRDPRGLGEGPDGGRDRLVAVVRSLLVRGEVGEAEHLMRAQRLRDTDLTGVDLALLAWRRGAWSQALEQAGRAGLSPVVVPPADALLPRAVAEIALARGRPVSARAVLDAAGAARVGLAHLRALTEADVEMALGSTQQAAIGLAAAAAAADEAGVVLGTSEIWLRLTELAHARGDQPAVRRLAARTVEAARAIGSDESRVHHCLAVVADRGDGPAAAEALRTAWHLGQPRTLAGVLERLARWVGPPEALVEAYRLYGDLGALLDRSRVRATMRELRVPVPNRAETAAEAERLLARLVAEGLSNQQLAAVLQTTPKSVESRLTRLFARTGYQSRAELAAAVRDEEA